MSKSRPKGDSGRGSLTALTLRSQLSRAWFPGSLDCWSGLRTPGAGASELGISSTLLDDLAEDVDHDMMEAVSRSVLGSMSEPHMFKSTDLFRKMVREYAC